MKKISSVFAAVCFFGNLAYAGQTEISIYNQDLALIKKSQTLTLNKGINEVVFDEVAEQFKPESAFIYGEGIKVLEQNYDYAGINNQTMLNAFVGQEVTTVRVNPSTGANIFEKAKLVSVTGSLPVLAFDYGIETAFDGRVLFDKIPHELSSSPVLMAKIESQTQGKKDLELAYLAGGLDWKANYIAKINDNKTLSFLGRAAISNNSGSGYDSVTVNLIAGDVHQVREFVQPMFKATRGALMMNKAFDVEDSVETGGISAPSNFEGYYVYHIKEKTSLKNGQIKQVSFINAPEVNYQKEGVINSPIYFNPNKPYFKDVHPDIFYHFFNTLDDGLGMPLPQGKISFYAPDEKDNLQFIGEDRMANIAAGQKVSIQLGKFFDIYSEGKVLEAKNISEQTYKKSPQDACSIKATTYRYRVLYKITNKNSDEQTIRLKQPLQSPAKIISATPTGQSGEGNVYEWIMTLPAGATQEVEAEVESVVEQRNC